MSRTQRLLFGFSLTLIIGMVVRFKSEGSRIDYRDVQETTPIATHQVIQLPQTLEPIADCMYEAKARIWVDANGNGVCENREDPLAGVAIRFGDLSGIHGVMNGVINSAILRVL